MPHPSGASFRVKVLTREENRKDALCGKWSIKVAAKGDKEALDEASHFKLRF